MEALVVVHLSSLDAYTHEFGQQEGRRLARAILEAVRGQDGPVYIIDQRWRPSSPDSQPRLDMYRVLTKLHLRKDISVVRHDERRRDLEDVLDDLAEDMVGAGVVSVVLGGVWFDPEGRMGCATLASRLLEESFAVRVDPRIVGCVPA